MCNLFSKCFNREVLLIAKAELTDLLKSFLTTGLHGSQSTHLSWEVYFQINLFRLKFFKRFVHICICVHGNVASVCTFH